MCQSEPSIHGSTLSVAEELGRDEAPDCCSEEMTRKDLDPVCGDDVGHIEYTCSDCGIVLEVDDLGLVWDIREKTAA